MTASKRIGKVRIDRAIIDQRVQRTGLNTTKLNNIVANFDDRVVGVIIVSERNKDAFVVLDGWHRVEACKTVAGAPQELDAIIWTGLSIQEEALLFRLHNNRTAVNAIDQFKALVIEGDETATKISNIVAEFGLPIGSSGFSAVRTALRIVQRPNGFVTLKHAFAIADQAWTADSDSFDGRLIEAFAEMLDHYVDFDAPGFVKRLAQVEVANLLRSAQSYHDTAHPGRFVTSMVTTLIPVYNKGRREENWLPAYLRRAKLRETPALTS